MFVFCFFRLEVSLSFPPSLKLGLSGCASGRVIMVDDPINNGPYLKWVTTNHAMCDGVGSQPNLVGRIGKLGATNSITYIQSKKRKSNMYRIQ